MVSFVSAPLAISLLLSARALAADAPACLSSCLEDNNSACTATDAQCLCNSNVMQTCLNNDCSANLANTFDYYQSLCASIGILIARPGGSDSDDTSVSTTMPGSTATGTDEAVTSVVTAESVASVASSQAMTMTSGSASVNTVLAAAPATVPSSVSTMTSIIGAAPAHMPINNTGRVGADSTVRRYVTTAITRVVTDCECSDHETATPHTTVSTAVVEAGPAAINTTNTTSIQTPIATAPAVVDATSVQTSVHYYTATSSCSSSSEDLLVESATQTPQNTQLVLAQTASVAPATSSWTPTDPATALPTSYSTTTGTKYSSSTVGTSYRTVIAQANNTYSGIPQASNTTISSPEIGQASGAGSGPVMSVSVLLISSLLGLAALF